MTVTTMYARGFKAIPIDDEGRLKVNFKGRDIYVKQNDFFKFLHYLEEHEDEEIYYETFLTKFGVTAMFTIPVIVEMGMFEARRFPVLNNAVAGQLEQLAIKEYFEKKAV